MYCFKGIDFKRFKYLPLLIFWWWYPYINQVRWRAHILMGGSVRIFMKTCSAFSKTSKQMTHQEIPNPGLLIGKKFIVIGSMRRISCLGKVETRKYFGTEWYEVSTHIIVKYIPLSSHVCIDWQAIRLRLATLLLVPTYSAYFLRQCWQWTFIEIYWIPEGDHFDWNINRQVLVAFG